MKRWILFIGAMCAVSVCVRGQIVEDEINAILAETEDDAVIEAVLVDERAPEAVAEDAESMSVDEGETADAAGAPESDADVSDPAVAAEADGASDFPEQGVVATAPASDAEEIHVSMAFEDAPLPDVVRAFREASGANIISAWTNEITHLVTMRLDNVPWKQGLTSILKPYGLEVKEEPRGSNIHMISERIVEVERFTQTFELNYAKAEDVAELFSSILGAGSFVRAFPSANAVIVKATESQLLQCEEMLKTLDKPARQVYIEARFVRLNSSASKQLGMKWDSLADWGVTIEKMSAGYERNKGTLARFDTGTFEVEETASIFPGTGRSYINSEGEPEFIDPVYQNAAIPISVFPDAIVGAPGAGRTAESMAWNRASGYGGQLSLDQFRLAISAFEQMDGAQMFSNPKIIVENETTARIDMTTKEPNIEIDYQAATQTGQRDSMSSKLVTIPGKRESWVGEAFFSYGITLEVTPRVSPSGLITVDIVPSISSKVSNREIPLGEGAANSYPIIAMQRLETTFAMADGKTAVIGGLTETTEGNIDSGIPLLRRIPWIGPRLFGWKSRQKTQEEIIIFVTVGVVDGETIEENIGMPKNAVLSRGLLDGSIKEPGDRTEDEMFNLEQKPARGFRIK